MKIFAASPTSLVGPLGFVVFALSACLSGPRVEAGWSSEALKRGASLGAEARFTNGDLATVWGAARGYLNYNLSADQIRDLRETLPTELTRDGKWDYLLHLQPISSGAMMPKVAPLMVVLPGIFSDMASISSTRPLQFFARQGMHVAVLNNSWSTVALQRGPLYTPGDVAREARLVGELVQDLRKRFGKNKFKPVHVYGESYGGFQAAVAAALDAEGAFSSERLITGETFILSAPLQMTEGLRRLDALLDAYDAPEAAPCREALRDVFSFGRKLVFADRQSDLPAIYDQCASATIGGSFGGGLSHTMRTLGLPMENNRFATYHNARLAPIVQEFARGDLDLTRLDSWLIRAARAGQRRFSVLSAQDDFLNAGQSWALESFRDLAPNPMILLPWGGHLGYWGSDATETLLRNALLYPNRN